MRWLVKTALGRCTLPAPQHSCRAWPVPRPAQLPLSHQLTTLSLPHYQVGTGTEMCWVFCYHIPPLSPPPLLYRLCHAYGYSVDMCSLGLAIYTTCCVLHCTSYNCITNVASPFITRYKICLLSHLFLICACAIYTHILIALCVIASRPVRK